MKCGLKTNEEKKKKNNEFKCEECGNENERREEGE